MAPIRHENDERHVVMQQEILCWTKRGREEAKEMKPEGKHRAKQEYLLMKDEKANLYKAQRRRADPPQGSFKFSLWSALLFLWASHGNVRGF